MPSYFIAQITINDPVGYQRYLDGFDEVFSRYGGRALAVDDAAEVLEGEWPFARTVVIEFGSAEQLLSWYRSEEYQRIAAHRRSAAHANIVLVHGRD
jgi:uncharacterized protein (DUF1330 family)